MNKPKLSIHIILLISLICIVVFPLFIIGIFWVGRVESLADLPIRLFECAVIMVVLVSVNALLAFRLFKRTIGLPLDHFLSTYPALNEAAMGSIKIALQGFLFIKPLKVVFNFEEIVM